MVHRSTFQRLERRGARYPEPLHDRLRMDPEPDELLRLPEQLRREHRHARRPVPDLVVLHLGDVHEDLRRRVVELDRLEDRRAVVRHVDVACRHRLQDFVHPFRSQRALHEVAERERTHERGKPCVFCLLLGGLTEKSISVKIKSDTLLYTSSLKMFTDIVERQSDSR